MEHTSSLRSLVQAHKGALLFSLLFILICAQPHQGALIVPFFSAALLYLLIRAILDRKNLSRISHHFANLTIICAAALILTLIHSYYYFHIHENAEQVKETIIQFERQHGRYPKDLSESGISPGLTDYHGKTRIFYRRGENPTPILIYLPSAIRSKSYVYDFNIHHWVNHTDQDPAYPAPGPTDKHSPPAKN